MTAQDQRQFQLALATLAALAALGVCRGVHAQNQPPLAPPSRGFFSMEPLVDTGESELGGRHVFVHVPGFFDLKLDTRANHQGARMKQTVMMGLVTISMDRVRDAKGRMSGPIEVRVMGLPIYMNEAARSGQAAAPSGLPPLPALPNSLDELSANLPAIPS